DMQDVPISIKNAAIPDFDTLYSLFRSKRSIRHYKPKPVADEILMKIIDAMRYAPTGGNNREMKIQIISDPAKIEKISNGVVDTLLKSPETSDGYRALLKYKQKKGLDPIFFKSPHVILITGDGENDLVNSAIAITYGMLAAECLGLGTCWIGLAYTSFIANEDLRKQTAGISNKIWGVFTIGEPNIKFHQSPPRPSLL
ncbi:MAG: hypothetical protein GY870_06095, partial [archaeon]|nr:hypothetical protein [archaeon]